VLDADAVSAPARSAFGITRDDEVDFLVAGTVTKAIFVGDTVTTQ
jgi:hypothetical protein